MRPRIVVLVGLPGSGKSVWAAASGAAALSSDEMRRLLMDDASDQTIHNRVFGLLRMLLRMRLELNRPLTIIDATNLTPADRKAYIEIAEMHDCEIEAVYFEAPVEECQRRNRARDRVVPDDVILDMAKKLRVPTLEEGFSRVTVIR